jgi:O-antigen/teichoic acid export membrane protein
MYKDEPIDQLDQTVETPSEVELPQVPSSDPSPSLKGKVIKGSLWTLFGHGANQVLRLGSNLILTRLLFPEAFGLMLLVQTFMVGLEMFSDVGINPSIVQNQRGEDQNFLDTAWTIQAFRGFALWFCACIIAVPAATFYKEPMLMQLLPVTGLNAFLAGLNSTKLATAHRKLDLAKLTVVELGSYFISIMVMIILAFFYRSVWALVLGGLVGSLTRLIASHIYLPGERNQFHWDKDAFSSLNRFGRWIFISTVLGFFASQGDRLVLGRLLNVAFLGIYGIALNLSSMANTIVDQISGKVLFPSYSELVRERPEELYPILRKARITLTSVSLGCSLFLVLLGNQLIDLLYDNRYAEAGWILQVLAIGFVARVLSTTYGDVLLAKGQTFLTAMLIAINITIQFTAMPLGNYLGGPHGVIVGVAFTHWIMYCVDAMFYSRLRLWQPEVDLPAIAAAAGMTAYVYFT